MALLEAWLLTLAALLWEYLLAELLEDSSWAEPSGDCSPGQAVVPPLPTKLTALLLLTTWF